MPKNWLEFKLWLMLINCASKHICSQLRAFGGLHDVMTGDIFSCVWGMLPSFHMSCFCRVISSHKFGAGTIIFLWIIHLHLLHMCDRKCARSWSGNGDRNTNASWRHTVQHEPSNSQESTFVIKFWFDIWYLISLSVVHSGIWRPSNQEVCGPLSSSVRVTCF